MTGFTHSIGVPFGPPDADDRHIGRISPPEWTRRRRVDKADKRLSTARDKTMSRLGRLGDGWQLIEASTIGLHAPDSFIAIGPGGVFAITVRSQGRSRVLISGDTVQIKGQRPSYISQARSLASKLSTAFSRKAGAKVPVIPILAFSGSGLLSLYGPPKDCVVMPYRELEHLLSAYGRRIANHTVDKLASIARHPSTVVDLRSDQLVASYAWQTANLSADKSTSRR